MHIKQELQEIYQNLEPESIKNIVNVKKKKKNIVNADDSPCPFPTFSLVWLIYD